MEGTFLNSFSSGMCWFYPLHFSQAFAPWSATGLVSLASRNRPKFSFTQKFQDHSTFSGGVPQSLANRDGRRATCDTISNTICYTLDSWLLDARRSVICMVVRVKVTYGLSITLNSPSEHPDAEADEHGVCVHVKSYTVVATPARVPRWYTMFAPSTGSAAKIFVFTTWARYAPRGWWGDFQTRSLRGKSIAILYLEQIENFCTRRSNIISLHREARP